MFPEECRNRNDYFTALTAITWSACSGLYQFDFQFRSISFKISFASKPNLLQIAFVLMGNLI